MLIVSNLRLWLLRGTYLFLAGGLAIVIWPGVIHHALHTADRPWEIMTGVVQCMLAAFGALCLIGLRYPLAMLPLLFWEMFWKALWLGIVAVPQWRAGTMDADTWNIAAQCLVAAFIPIVIPWGYVAAQYIRRPADRGPR